MSNFISIGKTITIPLLRDYIITHKVNPGDHIVLNLHDLKELHHEMKQSSETVPDIPLNLLGVIITQDAADVVPIGKFQIVKNEKPYL